ncbi:MAG: sugar epimerase [SAR324 cluster bacterium]|uniref:Sugar epimerase n=1 Tax=SAR324 cluster bacterium TaxID=2024889 RepID=A0A7X9FPM7_9DELT|nr:sugar epimerase [SAR324 cluster bacterium]
MDTSKPLIIRGAIAADDRGQVAFVNDFHFENVKRFYMVSNYHSGMVRAWHAHRHEAKYVSVVLGAAIVGAVKIDNWETPSKDADVTRLVLSATNPSILYIPAGYANGFMSLTEDTRIIFYSTSTLEDSLKDDIRYDARYWDIWSIVER